MVYNNVMVSRRPAFLSLVLLFFLLILGPQLFAQHPREPGRSDRDVTQPWITVSPLQVAEDDARTEALALVIEDNLELTLRLIGDYVVQPRPTGRTAPTDVTSAAAYAARLGTDYVVFGEVSERSDGSMEFELSVYSREEGAVTLERRSVAETIFDTFEVADELTADVLRAFTGQRIAYGRVELTNRGDPEAEYQVRFDGTVVGRNLSAVERVLVGERLVEVEVLTGPQAGEIVASRRVLVEDGSREQLDFTALAPVPEVVTGPDPDPDGEWEEREAEIAIAPEPAEPEGQPEDQQPRFVHRLIDADTGWLVVVPEVQTAGGVVAVGGYNIGIFRRRLQLSLLAGLGWAHGPKMAAVQRLTWAMTTRRIVPRLSLYATEVANFDRIAIAGGPSLGVEVRFNGRISSVIWENAVILNVDPFDHRYIVYAPSVGVTF